MGCIATREATSGRRRRIGPGALLLASAALSACVSPAYVDKGKGESVDGSGLLNPVTFAVHAAFDADPPGCIAILPFQVAEDAVALPALDRGAQADVRSVGTAYQPAAGGREEVEGAPSRTGDAARDRSDRPVAEIEAAEQVRRAFYAQLAPQGRRDVELALVDARIDALPEAARVDHARIGETLNCEALMVGRVTTYRGDFFAIYSRVAVGAEVKIIRASDGALLWEGDHMAQSHGGSVPLTPLGAAIGLIGAVTNLEYEQVQRVPTIWRAGWSRRFRMTMLTTMGRHASATSGSSPPAC